MPFNVTKVGPEILNVKRRLSALTQVDLANRTGVCQSRISLYETKKINLNKDEQKSIEKVLGPITWRVNDLNSSEDNFRMPREEIYEESYNKWLAKEKGLKIIYGDDDGITPPKLVPLDYKEDE